MEGDTRGYNSHYQNITDDMLLINHWINTYTIKLQLDVYTCLFRLQIGLINIDRFGFNKNIHTCKLIFFLSLYLSLYHNTTTTTLHPFPPSLPLALALSTTPIHLIHLPLGFYFSSRFWLQRSHLKLQWSPTPMNEGCH